MKTMECDFLEARYSGVSSVRVPHVLTVLHSKRKFEWLWHFENIVCVMQKLLFGSLHVVGTVCVASLMYMAHIAHVEAD